MKEIKREELSEGLLSLTEVIEVFLGILLTIAVIISTVQLIPKLFNIHVDIAHMGDFKHYLEAIFNLVIGIEALKMIYKHSPASAIEVLLYALSRELVVTETTALENLLGVVTIALLFAIRKFLFVRSFSADQPQSWEEKVKQILPTRGGFPEGGPAAAEDGAAAQPEDATTVAITPKEGTEKALEAIAGACGNPPTGV